MPITQLSSTNDLSFDEVITRLSQQSVIDGLIVVGSAATEHMTPASDYDLVLVLSAMPMPLHTGVTYIDGRFTDLLFHTTAEIEQILAATDPLDFWDWTGRLVGWLEAGTIHFDRTGQLAAAQAKVQCGVWVEPVGDRAIYGAWQSVNYNLAVVRRYLFSDDPTYLMAADLRMAIYAPQDLFWHYFTVRGLPPDSEKAQLAYLQEHDPGFLDDFYRFLSASNRNEKFRRYEALAEHVLALMGKLWQKDEIILNLDAAVITPELEQQALAFWEALVRGAPATSPKLES